jgi:hypothetical protein
MFDGTGLYVIEMQAQGIAMIFQDDAAVEIEQYCKFVAGCFESWYYIQCLLVHLKRTVSVFNFQSIIACQNKLRISEVALKLRYAPGAYDGDVKPWLAGELSHQATQIRTYAGLLRAGCIGHKSPIAIQSNQALPGHQSLIQIHDWLPHA